MSQTLQDYIDIRGLDATAVMNALQEHGVISDNAEQVKDVGNGGAAVHWLEQNYAR